ncbi:sensor histidine kinase [Ignavigranum ruoffiae]
MKEFVKNHLKHPLSLRWKWGIILFIVFSIFGCIILGAYRNLTLDYQKNIYMETYQAKSDATVRLLEEKMNDYNQSELMRTIDVIERDGTMIRLFNQRNQLVYETDTLGISTGDFDNKIKLVDSPNGSLLITSNKVGVGTNNQAMGIIQYIVNISSYDKLKVKLDNFLILSMGIMMIFTLLLSFLLSHLFLKPLHYLNNSLDLVEEESLSYMRVKQPRSNDEWSDLIIHINKLLDRIDKYVSNQKQFVEDVSHELRTPVAIVEGHLKLLSRWGKDDPEVLDESIKASLQEITRMKELVQEMLDLSRADHVNIDYKYEITDIYGSTRQTFNNFVMLHPDFNFFLDSDESEEEVYVQMYRNHFEQVLIILLDNAVKYSQNRKEIHVSISQSLNKIEIAVQDFGEGMSEEDKEQVFSRFYRVDKARSREKGGNGLGLSIAKQLIEGYRGEIRVDSSLNYGSIFYIELPILTDTRQIYKSKQMAERKAI